MTDESVDDFTATEVLANILDSIYGSPVGSDMHVDRAERVIGYLAVAGWVIAPKGELVKLRRKLALIQGVVDSDDPWEDTTRD